jgi:hypothetical protein
MRTKPIIISVIVLVILTLPLPVAVLTGKAEPGKPKDVRFATFNASLSRSSAGQLIADLSTPDNPQAKAVAEIIQRSQPDVLLINEFDFDEEGTAAQLFLENYLSISQNGAKAINYPYRFVAASNTGIPSGFDLDHDGSVGGANDAFGFGDFPGQYGMVVYSRFPLDLKSVRTFRFFLWKDMPGALLPDNPNTLQPADWYSPAELNVVRLSSKSHWDLPVLIGGKTVHLLASHPTPPVFDGPEDRNGRRNHDEIRFWADYLLPSRSGYIYDDNGDFGGLTPGESFVIVGDLNADPLDGDSIPGTVEQVLDHPLINTRLTPSSQGAVEQAVLQDAINLEQEGNPAYDSADFGEPPGNLRVDYVLPRKNLGMIDAHVFWPTTEDPLFRLVGVYPFPSSDHRLVWVDAWVPSY